MIASLRGELIHKAADRIIIDVNGVGYEVFLATSSLEQLPPVGQDLFVHIHTNVREDAITLFGFVELDEKEMFLLLNNVSGIGPKLAMGILGGMKPTLLARSIATKDIKLLTGLPGVGKKTAERLCLDLKDKVAAFTAGEYIDFEEEEAGVLSGEQRSIDVISALMNLGYQRGNAQQALSRVRKRVGEDAYSAMQVEELLRETLRSMA
jgi:Holliday junction DNA helicase RuvA